MNRGLKVLGMIVAFGGACLLFYGLLDPIFYPMKTDDNQLFVILGSIIFVGGCILIWIGKTA